MKHLNAGIAVLMMAATMLLALAALWFQQGPRPNAIDLDVNGIELPSAYEKFNAETSTRETSPLRWTLITASEPVGSTCGDERAWIWTNRTPPNSSLGDPTVRLRLCSTGHIQRASEEFMTTRIEETVVPQNDHYRALTVPTNTLDLQADESRLACVWGTPVQCRAWAFLARYDAHIVNATFVVAGHGGGISADDFKRLVQSVDAAIVITSP